VVELVLATVEAQVVPEVIDHQSQVNLREATAQQKLRYLLIVAPLIP
jgi:hypothetical protein